MPFPVAHKGSPTLGTCGSPPSLLVGPVSPNVFVNGIPVAMIGTAIVPHVHYGAHVPHPGVVTKGSPNVFVNGVPIALAIVPSTISCLDTIGEGSPNVYVN